MATKVRDAMTPGVQSVAANESLSTVAAMMRDNDVGSIPVVEGNRLVGIVTDRDIVVRGLAQSADLASLKAADVASSDVVAVGPEDNLDHARRQMADNQVRRLPVVEDGRVVGMLAQADIAVVESDKESGAMLEQISAPTSTARET